MAPAVLSALPVAPSSPFSRQYVNKPGLYDNEHQFMYDIYTRAMSCTRHYYKIWCAAAAPALFLAETSPSRPPRRYEKLVKAGARLPPPYWEGPVVPGHNATHDALVKVWRVENKVVAPMG